MSIVFTANIVKPRANGCNIVGQQLPTLLDVTCCVRLHTLLHVIGSCCAKLDTGQSFSRLQTDATLWLTTLDIVGSCCVRLHVAWGPVKSCMAPLLCRIYVVCVPVNVLLAAAHFLPYWWPLIFLIFPPLLYNFPTKLVSFVFYPLL